MPAILTNLAQIVYSKFYGKTRVAGFEGLPLIRIGGRISESKEFSP